MITKNFIAALIAAFGGFFLLGFVLPKYHFSVDARDALGARQTMLIDAQTALNNLHNLDGEFSANQQKAQRILVSVPRDQRSDYLTSSIQQAAIQTGIQLGGIAIGNAVKKDGADYQTTEVTLDAAGRYPDILHFFSALEQSVRLYDIAHVEFSRSGNSSSLKATIQLITYSLQ